MSKISIAEPLPYPTKADSVHGRAQAARIAAHKKKFAAKPATQHHQPHQPVDSYQAGGNGLDPELQKSRQMARIKRRQAIINRETAKERAWRSEAKQEQKATQRELYVKEHRRRHKAAVNKKPNFSVAPDFCHADKGGKVGKVGRANSGLAGVASFRSAADSYDNGDYCQAASDTIGGANSVLSAGAGSNLAPGLTKFAAGASAVSAVNDLGHGLKAAANGNSVEASQRIANSTLTTLAAMPGPVGVVGKVGLIADFTMKTSGANNAIARGVTFRQDYESRNIDRSWEQSRRDLQGMSSGQIREVAKRHPEMPAQAIQSYNKMATEHPETAGECFDEIQRIRRAMEGVR